MSVSKKSKTIFKKSKFRLLISFSVICFCCNNHSSSNENFSNKSENKKINKGNDDVNSPLKIHTKDEILSYKTILSGDSAYSLEIETTYLYDSLFLDKGWGFDLNDVVINQKIIFKYKGSIVRERYHDVRQIVSKREKGEVMLIDNIIRQIGFVKGKKGSFYFIEGSGGCNTCSEYLGYYTLQGKLIYKIYSSKMDKYSFLLGSFSEVKDQFGIPDSLQNGQSSVKVIWTFPPQYSGKIDATTLR